ncbi:hypothetical protein ScPMuIL_017139 [Solemya velum]
MCVLIQLFLTASLLLCAYGILFDEILPQYGRSLVLVGGNLALNNSLIYHKIVTLAGGLGRAKLGIITAASSNPEGSYTYYQEIFRSLGVLQTTYIPVSATNSSLAQDPATVQLIQTQTGFFFGGGDQYRIIQALKTDNGSSTPALVALEERFTKGAVIAGTSAGLACQTGTIMIRSGMSWESLRHGAHDSYSASHPDDLVYEPRGGLGFIDGYLLDQHFSQRGREGRLIRLLADTRSGPLGTNRGVGVDENTALVITHSGTPEARAEIIGQFGATFIDVSRASVINGSGYYDIRDIFVSYLTHGDEIFLSNMTITFSTSKTLMLGHEQYSRALTSADIFGGSRRNPDRKPEFVRAATSIFDSRLDRSTYGDTKKSNPRFRVTMARTGHDAEGWVERRSGFHSDITSYKNMYVEINELKV